MKKYNLWWCHDESNLSLAKALENPPDIDWDITAESMADALKQFLDKYNHEPLSIDLIED